MKRAVFICGPTAVGKTSVSVEIAKWLDTEIISFDSRQFFRELKIGAAPPSEEELQSVKHHLVAHLPIKDIYSAGKFETDALRILETLFKNKNEAILAGGSGLYMKALTEGFDDMPKADPAYRQELNDEYAREGLEHLQEELKTRDPAYYEKADIKNPQRIIRALEVIRATGIPYSSFRKNKKTKRPFEILKIGLYLPREVLYQRINERVDAMMEKGLLEEVKSLQPYKDKNALQTVGYKELFSFLQGNGTLEEAVSEIKKNTRRYAKRQLTWFRKDPEIKWFQPDQIADIKDYLRN